MDPKIVKQCTAAGGKVVNEKCVFQSRVAPKSKPKINLELNVGGINLKQAALWTFIGSIGFGAFMGVLALLGQWGETQMKVLATTGIIGGYGLLMIATFALFVRRSKWMTYLMSFTFTSSMLLGVFMVWDIFFEGDTFGKLWASVGLILGFGLVAIANNAIRKKYDWMAYVGWAFTGGAFLSVMHIVWEWNIFEIEEGYIKMMSTLIVLSVLGGHTALMLLMNPNKPSVKNMQWVTVGLASLTAIILIALINMQPENWTEQVRLLGIVGILNVAATIITPVLNRTK